MCGHDLLCFIVQWIIIKFLARGGVKPSERLKFCAGFKHSLGMKRTRSLKRTNLVRIRRTSEAVENLGCQRGRC